VSWTVIVPLKRLEAAKSRLRGARAGTDHEALVLAMALDTVAAALASPIVGRVVVVTGDPAPSEAAALLGAEVIADVPDAGLNPALAYAATLVRPRGVTATLPGVAALPADLPALRTEDLTEALRLAEEVARGARPPGTGRAFVADATGAGTVLLAAPPGALLEPCFGSGSAAAHAASGAVELVGDWPGLRHDVDTPDDLAEAFVLGVGARTAAIAGVLTPDPTGS
jgi:2-phospho-L-lactate/phosphoenolpyruvate guanylyltransferase